MGVVVVGLLCGAWSPAVAVVGPAAAQSAGTATDGGMPIGSAVDAGPPPLPATVMLGHRYVFGTTAARAEVGCVLYLGPRAAGDCRQDGVTLAGDLTVPQDADLGLAEVSCRGCRGLPSPSPPSASPTGPASAPVLAEVRVVDPAVPASRPTLEVAGNPPPGADAAGADPTTSASPPVAVASGGVGGSPGAATARPAANGPITSAPVGVAMVLPRIWRGITPLGAAPVTPRGSVSGASPGAAPAARSGAPPNGSPSAEPARSAPNWLLPVTTALVLEAGVIAAVLATRRRARRTGKRTGTRSATGTGWQAGVAAGRGVAGAAVVAPASRTVGTCDAGRRAGVRSSPGPACVRGRRRTASPGSEVVVRSRTADGSGPVRAAGPAAR